MLLPGTKEKEIAELLKILESETDQKLEFSEEELRTRQKRQKKKKPKKTIIFRQKNLHNFLTEKKIKAGKNFYESFILYYYFKEWCRTRKPKAQLIAYSKFTSYLKLFLPKKYNHNNMLFLGIDQNLRKSYLTRSKESAIRRYYEKEVYIPKRKEQTTRNV